MFKKIALPVVALIVVLIAAVLLVALTKPDSFGVQRTASIKAPAENIFALISDYHSWGSWSPSDQKDPADEKDLQRRGKGAVYEWEGNGNVVVFDLDKMIGSDFEIGLANLKARTEK